MKSFLLFLCLAAAEKLDRTYLPPPGAKFSGGAPGDIQAPFEIPKETSLNTLRPNNYNNGALSPDDTQIEIGINRGVPPRPGNPGNIPPDAQRSTDYYQNTYKVPTTTTSYAFTTTTTHPPVEGYETTGAINPATGLPTTTFGFPTTEPGFVDYQGNQQVPFQPTRQPGRLSPHSPPQYSTTSALAPSTQFFEQNRPGLSLDKSYDPVQSQYPGSLPESTQSSGFITTDGTTFHPNFTRENNCNFNENLSPGVHSGSVQRPSFAPGEYISQYQKNTGAGQQNTPVSTTFAPVTTPSIHGGDLDQGIISNNNTPFSQGNIPSVPVDNRRPNYPDRNPPQYNLSQGQQGAYQPESHRQPEQAQYQFNQGGPTAQPYPVTKLDEFGRPIKQNNNLYRPTSTTLPTTFAPNLDQFSNNTPGSQSSATTIYPSGSQSRTPLYPDPVGQTSFIPRPERPQAESDRNAVILNYENVITPDGFAYSFDTSNGIHADESGTAVDGVKAKGSYSYIGDDGKLYSVFYTADENGFQPHGDHLPTSPPIPEAIKKVIEQAKKDQEKGISDDGTYDEKKYGHKIYQSHRPQRPNQVNINSEIPERHSGQNIVTDKLRQYKPHSSNKNLVSTNQDESDYVEYGQNHDNSKDSLVDDDRQPDQKTSFVRPGKISEKPFRLGEKDSGDEIYSIRPMSRPSGDRRQFGGKFSVQNPSESGKNNLSPYQENNMDKENNNGGYRIKPYDNKSFQREKLGNIQEYEGNHEDYDSNRHPFGSSPDGRKKYDIRYGRPNQSQNNQDVSSDPNSFPENYKNHLRPVTSTTRPLDQSHSHRYQDDNKSSNINKYLPGNPKFSSTTYAPNLGQFSTGPSEDGIKQVHNSLGRIYHPHSISGASDDEILPTTAEPYYPTSDSQYKVKQGKSQPSFTSVPQQDNKFYPSDITKPGVNNQNQIPEHPLGSSRPSGVNKYTTTTPISEDGGYQYLPPQTKFEHGSQYPQGFRVPSNKTPSNKITNSNRKEVAKPFITPDVSRNEDVPEDDYDQDNEYKNHQVNQIHSSPRPTNAPSPTYYKEKGPRKHDEINLRRPSFSQNGRYDNRRLNRPDTSERTKTIDSTRQPAYQQTQTTARPQQQFQSSISPDFAQKAVHTDTVRPQDDDPQFSKDGNGYIYRPSSPSPSETTHFEVSQPTTQNPEQQHINRYLGVNDQTPSVQGFFPTTTQLPPQSQGRYDVRPTQNIYEQTPSLTPYQTKYRPLLTSGVNAEATSVTTKPDKTPFRRPSIQNQVPSTTYRPAFFPNKEVDEKQTAFDKFGRPVVKGSSPDFHPEPPNQELFVTSEKPQRPQGGYSGVDRYGRPTGPSFVRPQYSPTEKIIEQEPQITQGVYDRPQYSTTEKVIGEDFSGPKQEQKFDPERGYYY